MDKSKFSNDIINMLKEQGLDINNKIENTIDAIIYECFEASKEQGIEEGKKIGIERTCKEIDIQLSIIRSRSNISQ